MRVNVRVKPGGKTASVSKDIFGYVITTKAQAKDGKANKEALHLLADYLDLPRSCVHILRGHSSKMKIFEIL